MDASESKSARQPGGPLVSESSTLRRWAAASVAVHVCVLGALLYVRSPQLSPVERPGDATGHLLSPDLCAGYERAGGGAAVGEGAAAEGSSFYDQDSCSDAGATGGCCGGYCCNLQPECVVGRGCVG